MSAQGTNSVQENSRANLPPTSISTGTKPPDAGPYIFKHAPPIPVGDPWEIILKPELDADTRRCNGWKDEVQNILIFAGLFSAVVTAFVLESYKTLQPDPNDAIIGLLFHIANSLNNSSPIPSSTIPASITTPFLQSPSSIRINVLWFISLILSLTTVLIGTISLQWLREHQSYPNFSSKEKASILHMRLQAIDAWYVPHIFAGLPLLLQSAVALFLAGMIDFSLPLGPKIVIPVAITTFLTLSFLIATTVLPTFQCLSLFMHDLLWRRKTVPAPCAFKSPQSQAFRILIRFFVATFFHLLPQYNGPKVTKNKSRDRTRKINPLRPQLRHLSPYIFTLWDQKTWWSWPAFDQEWLFLRDACQQSIQDNGPALYEHRQLWAEEHPLNDATKCLIKAITEIASAKHTKHFLEAAVHCFQELSASVWTKQLTLPLKDQRKDRRNNYFEQLLSPPSQPYCSLPKWLIHNGHYATTLDLDNNSLSKYIDAPKCVLFHQEQIFYFLNLLLKTHVASGLSQYQFELWIQIMDKNDILPFEPANSNARHTESEPDPPQPFILALESVKFSTSNRYQDCRTAANMLSVVFNSAASHHISESQSMRAICTQSAMAELFCDLASLTADYMQFCENQTGAENANNLELQDISAQYTSTFDLVANRLKEETANMIVNSTQNTPSVFFYLVSIYISNLVNPKQVQGRRLQVIRNKDNGFVKGIRSILEALKKYRTLTKDYRVIEIESRFKKGSRFSNYWWDNLCNYNFSDGLQTTNQGIPSESVNRRTSRSHSNFVSRGNDLPKNVSFTASTSATSNLSTLNSNIRNRRSVEHKDTLPTLSCAAPNAINHGEDDICGLPPRSFAATTNSSLAKKEDSDPRNDPHIFVPPAPHPRGPHLMIEVGPPDTTEQNERA